MPQIPATPKTTFANLIPPSCCTNHCHALPDSKPSALREPKGSDPATNSSASQLGWTCPCAFCHPEPGVFCGRRISTAALLEAAALLCHQSPATGHQSRSPAANYSRNLSISILLTPLPSYATVIL